jgi:hypothetical protein
MIRAQFPAAHSAVVMPLLPPSPPPLLLLVLSYVEQWMLTLQKMCSKWMALVPAVVHAVARDPEWGGVLPLFLLLPSYMTMPCRACPLAQQSMYHLARSRRVLALQIIYVHTAQYSTAQDRTAQQQTSAKG